MLEAPLTACLPYDGIAFRIYDSETFAQGEAMGLNQEHLYDRGRHSAAVEQVVHFRRNRPPADTTAVTAIDLVYQAAEVLQSIEDRSAAAEARAHALARQAAEQLQLAETRMRALESTQREAEAKANEAHARADEAEQIVRATESRLSAAEQRARNAEVRAIEAEKILIRVEDAIRNQLLAKRQTNEAA